MKKITKLLLTVALCALTIIAAGCGGDNKAADKKADPNAPVKIGVTAGPHAEIMDNVKKLAEKQGLKIEVVEFSDYVTPNVSLAQGELFANSMQHAPYLAATLKKEPKFELVEAFKTVNFPMAIYSTKYKRLRISRQAQPSAFLTIRPTVLAHFWFWLTKASSKLRIKTMFPPL